MRVVLSLLFLPSAAFAQTTIDSHGIRAPGVRIDSSGVHTGHADVGAAGITTRRGAGEIVIATNGNRRSVDCQGGQLTVTGNSNRLTVANCPRIGVEGNNNVVTARFENTGALSVLGNGNTAVWSAPKTGSYAVSNAGNGNHVIRR